MTTPDLFALANANGPQLQRRYEAAALNAGERFALMESLRETVEHEGRLSMNMKSQRLRSLLDAGRHQNPHEFARERADREGRDVEELLRESQDDWYRKRVGFDRYFVNGERFRYCAINLGGVGLLYYGRFCVVVGLPAAASERSACLPGNSLRLYVSDDGQVDIQRIRDEIAPYPERHRLLVLKHAADADLVHRERWPLMTCRADETSDCYVEVIIDHPVTTGDIQEIRVDRIDEARLLDLVERQFSGDVVSEKEQADVVGLLSVMELLQKRGLSTLYRMV